MNMIRGSWKLVNCSTACSCRTKPSARRGHLLLLWTNNRALRISLSQPISYWEALRMRRHRMKKGNLEKNWMKSSPWTQLDLAGLIGPPARDGHWLSISNLFHQRVANQPNGRNLRARILCQLLLVMLFLRVPIRRYKPKRRMKSCRKSWKQ